MCDRRARTSALPLSAVGSSPLQGSLTRRTMLAGFAALTGVGLATRVRADDMSAEMILNDPETPFGGNPNGDVTIVSFFDYNCPFCKRTVEPLNAVLASDGNVRHVFKAWPILAQSSVYGAKLALAAKHQNRYEDAYDALMGIEGSRVPEERMRQALEGTGFDMTALETERQSPRRRDHDPAPAQQCAGGGTRPAGHARLPDRSFLSGVTGQHFQPDPLLLELADKSDDMWQGSSDPVQLPDDESVAVTGGVERLSKAGALDGAARIDILVDFPTVGLLERIALEVEALLGPRHPHISDQHGVDPLAEAA